MNLFGKFLNWSALLIHVGQDDNIFMNMLFYFS